MQNVEKIDIKTSEFKFIICYSLVICPCYRDCKMQVCNIFSLKNCQRLTIFTVAISVNDKSFFVLAACTLKMYNFRCIMQTGFASWVFLSSECYSHLQYLENNRKEERKKISCKLNRADFHVMSAYKKIYCYFYRKKSRIPQLHCRLYSKYICLKNV